MSKAAARVGGEPLRCKDCRWFVTVVAGFECHRLPPGDVGWSYTNPDTFCGEHSKGPYGEKASDG